MQGPVKTMRDRDLSISCVIPMYNEKNNVKQVIDDAAGILSQLVSDWEVIIVESGSTDGTREKIEEVIEGKDRVRVFYQDKKEGAGSAFRLGYSKCTKDLICHLEADNPFDMIYFRKALPILYENDFVIGYRVGSQETDYKWSYYNGTAQLLRAFYHFAYNLLIRMVFKLNVRDVNFSFKIFKRKDIQNLTLISKGWFIDAEILLELRKKGILPIEMPIKYRDRASGESTVNITTPFDMLYEMLKYIIANRKRDREALCRK